ncbi:alcohol dehydrogenase catalytic domain-containing protein [Streptomyces galilaeus]
MPVSDGAGKVVTVGPDVRRVRPGDRVTAALFPR